MTQSKDSEDRNDELIHIVWPETGLQTASSVTAKPKDKLTLDDEIEVSVDFVTLSMSPLECIQLASFLRMTIDELLERHPAYQRDVINAFDIKD